MLIHFEGRDWSYDPGAINTKEAGEIRAHTGLGILSWSKAVRELDEKCIEALAWVVFRQNGQDQPIESVCVPLSFAVAVFEAMDAEVAQESAAPKATARTGRSGRRASSSAPRTG